MGRNGKTPSVFSKIMKVINDNVGKVISSNEILLGNEPGRNSATAYVYKLIKLGYIEIDSETNRAVLDKETKYKIKKSFPAHYNSVMLMNELKIYNGLIPEKRNFEYLLNPSNV